jgi:hypothetical protein
MLQRASLSGCAAAPPTRAFREAPSGCAALPARAPEGTEEGSMLDLLYIGLTIVAFGVLWIVVKGVERFER